VKTALAQGHHQPDVWHWQEAADGNGDQCEHDGVESMLAERLAEPGA
jgi:hypothetical protein